MKITRTEGYKKPAYAVALAATMAVVTVTGCGADSPDLAGATTVYEPPEEEIQLAGDVAVIDYDGGIMVNSEPEDDLQLEGTAPEYTDEDDDIIRLEGDVAVVDDDMTDCEDEEDVTDTDDCKDEDDVTDTDRCKDEDDVTYAYYEPDDHLVLDGGAPLYEP